MNLRVYILLLFVFTSKNFAQAIKIDTISYAHIKIAVPQSYKINTEFGVGGSSFSAQWIYLTKEMYDQGFQKEFVEIFGTQTQSKPLSKIKFYSKGSKFTGQKFYKKDSTGFPYRILAWGIINNQPLILNLGFEEDPEKQINFEPFVQNFIKWR